MKFTQKILIFIIFLGMGMMLEAKDLKIMTYNIYGARLTTGEKLGEVIKRYTPDFIALQEVDKNTRRSSRKDVTEEIAKKLGYDYYYFQKTLDFDGGEFGLSIISKYPLERYYIFELPSIGNEKRHLLGAQISKDIFGKTITIVNAHLNYQNEIKDEETKEVLSVVDAFEGEIKFLVGDLNMLPSQKNYINYIEKWEDSYKGNVEDNRIDYIFGDKSKKWELKNSNFVNDNSEEWNKLSDHFPYTADFEIIK